MNDTTINIQVAADCVVAGTNAAFWQRDVRKLRRTVDTLVEELREMAPANQGRRKFRTSRLVALAPGALGTKLIVPADIAPSELDKALRRAKRAAGTMDENAVDAGEALAAGGGDTPNVAEPADVEVACAQLPPPQLAAGAVPRGPGHDGQIVQQALEVEEEAAGAQPDSTGAARLPVSSTESAEQRGSTVLSALTSEKREALDLANLPSGIDDFVEAIEAVYLVTLADRSTVVVPAAVARSIPVEGACLSEFIDLQTLRERTSVLQGLRKVTG